MLAGLLFLGAAVLVGLAHRPTQAQRATDVKNFLTDMKYDIQSCAGGVRDSTTALNAIKAGTSHDTQTAVGIARFGAKNCSPANNQQLDDLTQYQVTESLAGFHLDPGVNGLVTWAFPDAQRVMNDIANELSAPTAAARSTAAAALERDTAAMNRQRAAVYKIMQRAITGTGAHASLPYLPG
jgi:hypothetical protein